MFYSTIDQLDKLGNGQEELLNIIGQKIISIEELLK